jgi:hypothetical protein
VTLIVGGSITWFSRSPPTAATTTTPVPTGVVSTASVATFRSWLTTRLVAQHLNVRWVVCVRNDNRFHGVPIVRCNVDFGDPHIEAYCSVLIGGQLVTNQEDPAIPCGHDNSGYSAPIQLFG